MKICSEMSMCVYKQMKRIQHSLIARITGKIMLGQEKEKLMNYDVRMYSKQKYRSMYIDWRKWSCICFTPSHIAKRLRCLPTCLTNRCQCFLHGPVPFLLSEKNHISRRGILKQAQSGYVLYTTTKHNGSRSCKVRYLNSTWLADWGYRFVECL